MTTMEHNQPNPITMSKHKALLNTLADTYRTKNADYGNAFSDLYKEIGIVYAYAHLAEKLHRIKSLMTHKELVTGESMRDSLLDLANYALLTIIEVDREKESQYIYRDLNNPTGLTGIEPNYDYSHSDPD